MIKHGIVHILAPIWIRIHFLNEVIYLIHFFAICIKYRNKHINCLISFQLTKNVCNPTTHPHGCFLTQFNKLLHLCWIICCLGFCRFNVILFIYFLFGVFNFYRFFVLFGVEFFFGPSVCLWALVFFLEFFLLLFQIPCSILNLECH